MIVAYTTIFGHSDHIKKAPRGFSRAVCFVDDPSRYPDARGWELVKHPVTNPRRDAWHLRCIPHLLFPSATKTFWLDASFTLIDFERLMLDSSGHDISCLSHHVRHSCYEEGREIIKIGQAPADVVNRQLNGYHDEGFRPTSLTISCLWVRNNTPLVTAFNERWDEEIKLNPGDNTQLSSDYSAWKVGVKIHHLQGEYRNNPYAHQNFMDHKLLRQPYDTDTQAQWCQACGKERARKPCSCGQYICRNCQSEHHHDAN